MRWSKNDRYLTFIEPEFQSESFEIKIDRYVTIYITWQQDIVLLMLLWSIESTQE